MWVTLKTFLLAACSFTTYGLIGLLYLLITTDPNLHWAIRSFSGFLLLGWIGIGLWFTREYHRNT